MAADISLAVPLPPDMSARPKIDLAAVFAIFAVAMLVFLSFGIVADLLVIIAARALGAPDAVTWTAGAFGALAVTALSLWAGYDTWRRSLETNSAN